MDCLQKMTKKILCLHGYAMNSEWLQRWLVPIETALPGRVELVYPQGPIACPAAEVRAMATQYQVAMPEARIGAGQNWCWYRASDDKPPEYLFLDQSLAWLKQYCEEHGPWEGVLGWSQGATMAAILSALQQNGSGYDFGLSWAVLCGGFLPTRPGLSSLFEPLIALPSLHVVGKKETEFMRQRALKLFAAFRAGDWLETPVGHVLPVHHPDYMLKIADWIKTQMD